MGVPLVTDNAFVSGNERHASVRFVEDERGDLVDLDYRCAPQVIWENGCLEEGEDAGLAWPAWDWPDYDVHCGKCGRLINKGRGEE